MSLSESGKTVSVAELVVKGLEDVGEMIQLGIRLASATACGHRVDLGVRVHKLDLPHR